MYPWQDRSSMEAHAETMLWAMSFLDWKISVEGNGAAPGDHRQSLNGSPSIYRHTLTMSL